MSINVVDMFREAARSGVKWSIFYGQFSGFSCGYGV
jgi:hypothetical protein